MSSVPTSNKVIVLRKGKRKKTNNFFDKSLPDENETEDDLSEDLSSEEEFVQQPNAPLHKPTSLFPGAKVSAGPSAFFPKPAGVGGTSERNSSVYQSQFMHQQSFRSGHPEAKQNFSTAYPESNETQSKGSSLPSTTTSDKDSKATQPGNEFEDAPAEEDDEDDEIDFMDYEESVRQKIEQTRNQMKYILANFTPEQMHRYETFRRVGLSRAVIKKIMQQALGHTVNPNAVFLMGGVAKVYAGELIEEAKDIMNEWGETGPLLPSHLIEAHRRLKTRSGTIFSCNKYKRRLF